MKMRTLLSSVAAGAVAMGVISTTGATQNYSDHTVVLHYAEYITDPSSDEMGGIEFLQRDTGNGQLTGDFVFGDPRNAQFDDGGASVSYGINMLNTSSDARLLNQIADMQTAVDVWDGQNCSDMQLDPVSINSNTPGVVELFFQGGGIQLIQQADATQMGFYSAAEFPYFAANPNVLGVAFTLSWVDGDGNLTDIDNNGKSDVAFREIYYNDEFEWADDGTEGTQPDGIRYFDFPTVAIHEHGHGFSMAHFGLIARKNGNLVAHPRAIMNAIYGGTLREPTGRDEGSHCSNWAQWPNN